MLLSDANAEPIQTLVADLRDYPQWRRGRLRYGVWVVPLDDPALLDYVSGAREQLADLLHPGPRRQPHLTVFVCGFHGEGERDDDFPPARLEQQVALLQAQAGAACHLPLARLDSFASAAFIPVGDPMGRLAQWRRALATCSGEIRQAPYIAHITLGLYRRSVSAPVLRQRLGDVAAPPPLLRATELQYVTYDARDQLGPLECVRRVVLDQALETSHGTP
jgi:hypothetical protein